MLKETFGVILAGGQGTRFWPISRAKCPKQFLSISTSGESLIQATARRMGGLVSVDKQIIVTNDLHKELIEKHVPKRSLICEPLGRNTAASIGLAAIQVRRTNPDAVMIVLPADHAIGKEEQFLGIMQEAVKFASKNSSLVTIGIKPSWPNTGYGYIKRGPKIENSIYKVSRFFEKPNLERAKKYLENSDFYWNSGMFVWKASAILAAIEKHMPVLYAGLLKIEKSFGTPNETKVLHDVFESLESISIDFGVMELETNCVVLEAADFGWNDVGSWDAWASHFKKDAHGNLSTGEAIIIDSNDSVVYSQDRLVAVLGCQDMVIIDSPDALLVCPRSHVQDVRQVVQELKKKGRTDLI